MNIDDNLVTAIVGGAMPFLITLVVFGAPVLFFYLRWQFKLREKELDLQRELAMRGINPLTGASIEAGEGREPGKAAAGERKAAGGVRAPSLGIEPSRLRVESGHAADDDIDLGLAVRERQAEKLLGASSERAADERVKF
jgi:hypothetical protein